MKLQALFAVSLMALPQVSSANTILYQQGNPDQGSSYLQKLLYNVKSLKNDSKVPSDQAWFFDNFDSDDCIGKLLDSQQIKTFEYMGYNTVQKIELTDFSVDSKNAFLWFTLANSSGQTQGYSGLVCSGNW